MDNINSSSSLPDMNQSRPFNDPIVETRLFRCRVFTAMILILTCFGMLLLRLAYLQIFKYDYYTNLSRNNSIGMLPIQPTRGLIYDCNGKLLAGNVPVFSLDIIPSKTNNLAQTIAELKKLLNLDPQDIERFYKQLNKKRNFEAIPLKVKLSPEDVAKFYVDKYRFPSAEISVRLIRHYPYQNDLVSVLGYTGRINQGELASLDPNLYNGIDYIGKIGVEKYFETELRGKVGYKQVEINAQGQIVRLMEKIFPVPGNDLYLTIDAELQEVALKAMKHYHGALVAIDPTNGNVLAMVSNPSYDPNIFVRGITQKEFNTLQRSPDQPLFNRAICGQYPPASTIKPLLALQGLEKGAITPELRFFDPGYFQLTPTSRKYRNWRKQGQGWINLRSAIAQSCDTYFYVLANKIGIEPITKIEQAFGYGSLTGIQMSEELPGIVPSPATKLKIEKTRWYAGDTLNISIGQGLSLVTPLQLATATAIFANRGIRYKPNLLLQVRMADGNIIKQAPQLLGPPVQADLASWEAVINGMQAVITDSQGSGYRFGNPTQYTVAAKTGTAQLYALGKDETYVESQVKVRLRDNSMFMAFAPVKNPRIAIAVAIQNNPVGAEMARKVIDYYLLTQKHLFDGPINASTQPSAVVSPLKPVNIANVEQK